MGIGGFALTNLRRIGDEDKTIPFGLIVDTSSPMIAPPVFAAERILRSKKADCLKLDRFKFWFWTF